MNQLEKLADEGVDSSTLQQLYNDMAARCEGYEVKPEDRRKFEELARLDSVVVQPQQNLGVPIVEPVKYSPPPSYHSNMEAGGSGGAICLAYNAAISAATMGGGGF